VLSRLIVGSRISLVVGFTAVLLSAALGVAVGLISGYFGGWFDSLVMRIVDAWLAFPFLLLAIAIVAVLGRGLNNIVIALVITGWVLYARLVRGETLSLREREFVLSARGLGARASSIMFRHILPNCLAPIMVVATLEIGVVIVTEASLSFLGLGAGASEPSWGGMLADGRAYLTLAWWLATLPGLAILVVVLAVNVLGDALRDALDPRHENAVAVEQVSA
jgi:peptide/nickel transport system permease protein